jgi:hypothetical protein
MGDVRSATGAEARAAEVLLRSAGGRTMLLRVPSPAVPGDVTEQLGIAVPEFQDLALAPVVYRKARARVADGKAARWELLVSAMAVQTLVDSLAYSSAEVLFATAYGVLSDGVLMEIESATAAEAFGGPYVYRLVVRAPVAVMV